MRSTGDRLAPGIRVPSESRGTGGKYKVSPDMGGPRRQGHDQEGGVEGGSFLWEGDLIEGMGISTGATFDTIVQQRISTGCGGPPDPLVIECDLTLCMYNNQISEYLVSGNSTFWPDGRILGCEFPVRNMNREGISDFNSLECMKCIRCVGNSV